MSTRTMLFAALLVFAVALAIVVGSRLSEAAMSVVLGVAVGVAVGIPTSVLVAVLTRQVVLEMPTNQGWQAQYEGSQDGQPSNGRSRPQTRQEPTSQNAPRQPLPTRYDKGRQFTVVGGAAPPLLDEDDFRGNGNTH